MRLLAVLTVLVSLLLQTVAAQDTASGSFNAPLAEDANLGVYAFLLLVTLIQFLLATSFLFRTRSHFIPGVAVVVTLVFLLVSYALYIVVVVDEFTVTDLGDLSISPLTYTNLRVVTYILSYWVDPLMFLAVVLVLRDRYLSHTGGKSERPSKRVPLTPLIIIACTFVVLMVTFASAASGLYGTTLTSFYRDQINSNVMDTGLNVVKELNYTYVAFFIVAALFLIVFAILVKKSVKSDTITSIVVFGVAPLFALRAISTLVVMILGDRLPSTDTNAFNLDLASTVTLGTLCFAILCLLVFCLMSVRLWDVPGEHVMPPYSGGYPAPYLSGMQPVAQFPGQWGFPGQQPQPVPQGYPSPYGPHQVNNSPGPPHYVNTHHNQQPNMGPVPSSIGEVKTTEGILIQNKPSPPPAS